MTNPLSDTRGLKALGEGQTQYKYDAPDIAILEWFQNPMMTRHSVHDGDYTRGDVEITAPEFTSLCPKTGQPDFAQIKIFYTPRNKCVESKSLKLYLGAFRNFGEFHEACVERIRRDLQALLDPYFLEVVGEFTPRGGISFWPRSVYIAPDRPKSSP